MTTQEQEIARGDMLHDLGESEEETTLVVATEGQPIALETGWTPSQVQLVKETIAKSAELTDDEFRLFIATCQRMQLDPLARQIHAVKRFDSKKGEKVLSIQVGIDGYRSIADRTGLLAGNDDPVYEKHSPADKQKADWPQKATVTVHKLVAGEPRPFRASARWAEYYPGGGGPGFMFRKMPFLMLGKCAEALALRKAFPAELGGVYIPEEMAQAGLEHSGTREPTRAPDDDTPKPAAFVPPKGSIEELRKIAAKVEVPFGNEGTRGKPLGDLSQEHVDRLAKWVGERDHEFAANHTEFVWAIEEIRSKTEEELEARRALLEEERAEKMDEVEREPGEEDPGGMGGYQ